MVNRYKKIFFSIIGWIIIILIWEIFSLSLNNDVVFPDILSTIKALGKILIDKYTYVVLGHTLFRLLISLLVSFVLALIFAIISYLKEWARLIFTPIVLLLKTIPVASIIIIMIIFIGHNNSPYYIASFVIFPIMYEGIYGGLKQIDDSALDEIKTISNFNLVIAKDIYLPLIKNNITTSLLQSIGLGLKVMLMAEFISQPTHSIGRQLLEEKNYLNYDAVFAWTLLLIMIVIILELLTKIKKEKDIV